MGWNKPTATGWQLDRCDVCGDKMHRRDLVRTQVEFLRMIQENYLNYSSYDGTYWVVDTSTDAGSISFGTRADKARTTLTDYTTVGYADCVQTWTGSGTMRMATATPSISASGIVTFSAHVGPNERNTSPEMTIAVGITNNDGSSKQAIKSFVTKSPMRVWFQETSQTLTDYGLGDDDNEHFFYIQVTNAGKWWADEMQLEVNTNSLEGGTMPGPFQRVSSTYAAHTTEDQLLTSRKVCQACLEPILSKSNKYGWTEESPTDEPVETLEQDI
eukprot:GHVO01048243.1.p1 GENE.GHVO01048243.1~~GHVO01048243.1.p1  ORF type:complete len:272 (+),score=5.27 GHVO01048243.1:378-1193(+)